MAAMKAKETVRLNAVRSIKSAILLAKTAEGASGELTDGDIVKLIQKLAKQRKEAAEQFAAAGAQDRADSELAEVKVLEVYLPAQLSPEEVERIVRETVAEVGATSPKEMGKVMKAVMPKLKGQADGKLVKDTVSRVLQG